MTFANTLPSEDAYLAGLPRSVGRVEIGFQREDGDTVLKHLFQSGCGRVRFPTVDHVHMPEAVLINTAGGLTGGDVMNFTITAGPGTELTVTGQAAEKIYKSIGPEVVIGAEIFVESDAYLEWLPQETILFEKGRLRRLNKIHLAKDAKLLALEATILGRRAHGETLSDATITDGWKIWKEGKLVWFDQFCLNGNLDQLAARRGLLDGATSFATIVLALPDITGYVEIAREVAELCESTIGVTSFDGELMIVRFLDKEAYSLR
ncbi:MAG: urease accessory protein UreD, partial [Sneathiella sp.]|nr:urease accessory protein UreD [Sneathiella sp.]